MFKAVSLIKHFSKDWSMINSFECIQPKTSVSSLSVKVVKWLRVSREVWWSNPPQESFKLIFNGSKPQDGSTACGFIIREYVGNISLREAISLNSSFSILVTEAWGT